MTILNVPVLSGLSLWLIVIGFLPSTVCPNSFTCGHAEKQSNLKVCSETMKTSLDILCPAVEVQLNLHFPCYSCPDS